MPDKATKGSLIAAALAAVGASLCCVAPLVLVALGVGGAWVSHLTALEPYRPVFVGLVLLFLALAWRRLQHASGGATCQPGQLCAQPAVNRRYRMVFWIVAAGALLLLIAPYFAPFFY